MPRICDCRLARGTSEEQTVALSKAQVVTKAAASSI
jgi:hypothetical protein